MKIQLFLFALAVGLASGLSAQTYTATSITNDYASNNISTTGTLLTGGAAGDDSEETVAFTGGFTFDFYGTTYTSVIVNSNGWIYFGASQGLSAFQMRTPPTTAPATGIPNNYVSPLYDDLDPSGSAGTAGEVRVELLSAPSRFVIHYDAFAYSSTTNHAIMAIVLYATGTIEFHYAAGHNYTGGVAVGVENSTGTEAQPGPNGLTALPAASDAYRFALPTSAPTISSTAPTSAFVGQAYSYTVAASGSPAPTFSISGTLPTWLTWDGTDTLSGTPAAGDVGTVGPLTITATNGVSPDDTEVFSITVSPSAPEIEILDPNATSLASGSTVGVYAALATAASTGTFTVNNNGNVTLNITSTTTTNMVNCTTSNTGPATTIAASGNDTLMISVTPTAPGAFSFTVTIVNDDSDEGTFVLNFAGEAKAAADNEIVVLDPNSASITNGGTFSESNTGVLLFNRAFTIRNIGGNTLTLSGGPVAISALNNCTVTLNQPASSSLGGATTWLATDEAFSLDITPTAAGTFSFLVTIGNDDADEAPFTFTFSGNTASGGGGGGGGGGDDGGCSTGSSNGLSIFALLGILSVLAISIRMRGSKA